MKKQTKNGFTLVELLAVIVILAIILVIAVPKVMDVINDSKKATLESTAKMIASSAEKRKVQNSVLGNEEEITCKNVAKINDLDYQSCSITFDGNVAKVTITGKGKFEGLYVCSGTKTSTVASEESCGLRTIIVNPDGGNLNTTYKEKYEAGSIVTLTVPTKEGYTFDGWEVVSGSGASVNGNTLTMGTEATEIKAKWYLIENAVTKITNLLAMEETLNNGLINPKVTYEGTEYDTGIRYTGDSPNNYVYFNCEDKDSNNVSYGVNGYDYASSCEVWRIIGVFDTKSSEGGIAEKRIKLINTNSTFKASWDSSASIVNNGYGINQWGPSGDYEGADLMRLLNGYYIGVEEATCRYCNGIGQETCEQECTKESLISANMKPLTNKAKSMIGNAVWDTYGVKWPEDGVRDSSWTAMAYLEEKGISAKNTGKNLCIEANGSDYKYCNDSVDRTTRWTGLVGLMSVVDIGYANGWLYDQGNSLYQWSVSPGAYSGSGNGAWRVGDGVADYSSANYQYGVFASVYLNSGIQIIGGDGESEPYKLK